MAAKKQAKTKTGGTRRERVESKEGAIVAVAYEMIAAQGFAKTTMAEIAKAAGVADGTLYLYFNNKEALATAVLGAFYSDLTASAQRGVAKCETTEARLKFIAKNHLTTIIEKQRILELLTILDRSPESYDGSEIYKMNRNYVAVFDEVVREGVWRGDISGTMTPWILRDIFFGALEYSMRTVLIKNRQRKIGAVVNELAGLIVAQSPAQRQKSSADPGIVKIAQRLEKTVDRLEGVVTAKSHAPSGKSSL